MKKLFLFLFLTAITLWLTGQEKENTPISNKQLQNSDEIGVIETKNLLLSEQKRPPAVAQKSNLLDIQIGTGNIQEFYPIVALFQFSYTQNIYLASEIGYAGQITKIKYYFAGNNLTNSKSWVIYMGHTTKSYFNDVYDWVPVSQLTEVFNDTIPWSPHSWVEIPLTTPFNYNGVDNLVIAVDENSPNSNDYEDFFYCTQVSTARGIKYRNDYINANPSDPNLIAWETNNTIANIILTIIPNLTNQNDLAIVDDNIPEFLFYLLNFTPSITIFNNGTNEQSNYAVRLKIYDNQNNEVYSQTINNPGTIVSGGYLTVNFNNWQPAQGEYRVKAEIILTNDENPSNNVVEKSVLVGLPVIMYNGVAHVDYGYFYDTGGEDSNYSNDENLVLTISPTNPNYYTKVEFLNFEVEEGYDSIMIYNAPNTQSGYLGKWDGLNSPGTIIAQNPSGALTFKFKSDNSITKSGWKAKITTQRFKQYDMAVLDIKPSYLIENYKIKPKVVLKNNGKEPIISWTLHLTDGQSYSSTRENLTYILPFQTYEVEMDQWTPSSQNNHLTATITIANDEDTLNNNLTKDITILNYSYSASTFKLGENSYLSINLQNGQETLIASNQSISPLPIGEDFSKYGILRIYNNRNFGIVLPDGQFDLLGTIQINNGIPTAIAYNWDNDLVYIIVYDANYSRLYKFDIYSLKPIRVGTDSLNYRIYAIDFADDGYIYAVGSNNFLYKIDTLNGIFTQVGNVGLNLSCEQDLAWDYSTQKLYTIACLSIGNSFYSLLGYYDLTNGGLNLITEKGAYDYVTLTSSSVPPQKFCVTFRVYYANSFINNAQININNSVLLTNSSGIATINLTNGTYSFTVHKNGFHDYQGQLTVADADVNVNVSLLPLYLNAQNKQFEIYPNPAEDFIYVKVPTNATLKLLNSEGKLLKTLNCFDNYVLNISDLPTGVYTILINTEQELFATKIIKK